MQASFYKKTFIFVALAPKNDNELNQNTSYFLLLGVIILAVL